MSNMVTVSVMNIITGIVFKGKRISFAVWDPSDSTKLQSLSAGPKFPEKAKDYLINSDYKAAEDSFIGDDAQCDILEEMLIHFQGWLHSQLYLYPEIAVLVINPFPELKERLTGKYWDGFTPPLTDSDFSKINLSPAPFYKRQPPSDEEEVSAERGLKVRFFREWNILIEACDTNVFDHLTQYPAVVLLTEDALKSTGGGRHPGKFGDYILADNIGVVDYQPELVQL